MTEAQASNPPADLCLLAESADCGDREQAWLDLLEGLRSPHHGRFRPWVLLPRAGGPLQGELDRRRMDFGILSVPEPILNASLEGTWSVVWGVLRSTGALREYLASASELMRTRRTALIHSTGPKTHALSTQLRERSGIPVVWRVDQPLPDGLARTKLRNWQRELRIPVLATGAAAAAGWAGSEESSNVRLIVDGVDGVKFHSRQEPETREGLGASADGPLIGWSGKLADLPLALLEAARRILELEPRSRFAVLARGAITRREFQDATGAVKARAAALGMSHAIRFADPEMDPAVGLGALDLLLLPGSRRIVLEAQACGVTVIDSRSAGHSDLLDEGRCGWILESGSPEDLAQAAMRLFRDPALRASMRSAAHDRVLAQFGLERQITDTEALFATALGS